MALQHQPCQGVLRTSAIVAHDEQRENVLMRIERLLMDGVFPNGLGFEKLNTDGSMGTLFSIRLNNKARLLLTKVWLVHGWYWVLLDVLEKHEYDRSKLLASGGLTHFFQSHRLKLEQDIRDNGYEVILPQQEEARAEGAEWVDFEFFNHQLIVLNEQQDDAAQTNLPIIVNGIPGSGKTCVAMSLLMQCLDANSERMMYVTSSNDLVSSMCATWRQAPSYDAADEAKLSLKSYKTLINELFPETRRLQQTGEQSFFNWFAKYRKQYKDLMSHQRDVYQEMRIISGLDIDEYLQLGKRQSYFYEPLTRERIHHIYGLYCQYLNDNECIDFSFYPHSSSAFLAHRMKTGAFHFEFDDLPCFQQIVIDEAQDFSGLQHRLLIKLAENKQVAMMMDTNQSLLDSLSKLQNLKFMLGIDEDRVFRLNESFRCSRRVLQLANTILSMKYHVTGGMNEKGWNGLIHIQPSTEEGYLSWHIESAELIASLQHDLASIQCAVVTSEQHLAHARILFPGAIVLTPAQAKGLEYDKVIAYQLLNDAFFEEMNPLLAGYKSEEKKTFSRPKQ